MSEKVKVPVDEKIIVEITPDKMVGVVSFEEPMDEGKLLSKEAIEQAISDKGIISGIQDNVLQEIFDSRRYHYKYVIARGTPATKGKDASLEYKFDRESLKVFKPAQNKDGTVNFKDLNIVQNVRRGDVLVVKVPAEEGTPGENILGQPIRPHKSKDARMPQGKNTVLLGDGVTLVADIDGKLCYDGHNVYLSPVFIVEEDVDSSTGNINFVGDVIVNGNVKNGFKVTASGTVEVKGCVEAAEIIADGNVVVWYGIQGMDKGYIHTKGNLVAKFIQNANVEADGNIITEAIMHSRVSAVNIDVSKGKGLIVGGEIVAANKIDANTIGSPMATQTSIQIGISPGTFKEYLETEKEYKNARDEMEKISKSVTFLMSRKDMIGQDKQQLLHKLLTTKVSVEAHYKEVANTYKVLGERVRGVNNGLVKVKNKVFPGVKITIGAAIKYISEDYSYCTIQKNGPDIEMLSY